jgi:uncharacterized protein
VRGVDGPTLVVHSADDEVVPLSQGRQVFACARDPKRFLLISGSHGEGFFASGAHYIEGLRRFLSSEECGC